MFAWSGLAEWRQGIACLSSILWADLNFSGIRLGFECLLKLVALSPRRYFSSGWDSFDFALVILSYAAIMLEGLAQLAGLQPSVLRALRVFRLVRILRAFRIFRWVLPNPSQFACSVPCPVPSRAWRLMRPGVGVRSRGGSSRSFLRLPRRSQRSSTCSCCFSSPSSSSQCSGWLSSPTSALRPTSPCPTDRPCAASWWLTRAF